MRYFTYKSIINTNITISEEEIHRDYWAKWYDKMCRTYGQDYVDRYCSFDDCIEEWMERHDAKEVKYP